MTSRRAVLGGVAGALAAPRLALAAAPTLRERVPGWARIRLAVPSDMEGGYASPATIAAHAHGFVSENFTKARFLWPESFDPAAPPPVSLAAFERQRAAIADAGGDGPWDLHGAVWHQSMGAPLRGALDAAPEAAPDLLTRLLEGAFAGHPFASFDVNEVQRAFRPVDRLHDHFRGPVRDLPGLPSAEPNASPWFEAFARAGWPHGPGHWWLAANLWAAERGRRVIHNDFGIEGGRPWGEGEAVPGGQEAAGGEMLKRRRVLDAVNYALVHGGRVDAVGFQLHLDARRAVDATDLAASLRSLDAMGVGVEVTELDAAPREDAPAQAAALLSLMLAHSRLSHVGGWTGWAPNGGRRLTMVDRAGTTPLGTAAAEALSAAAAPAERVLPPERRYGLTHGVTAAVWRAARDPGRAGFEPEGNARGTWPARVSGGAVLRLTNAGAVPGGPVGPVWSRRGRLADLDPAAMALALQWEEGAPGPRLALLRDGRPLLTLSREDGLVARAGGREAPLGPERGQTRAAVSLAGGTATVAAGGATAALALGGAPDAVLVLGDGGVETRARAVSLVVWPEPLDEAALGAAARPEGARFLRWA